MEKLRVLRVAHPGTFHLLLDELLDSLVRAVCLPAKPLMQFVVDRDGERDHAPRIANPAYPPGACSSTPG